MKIIKVERIENLDGSIGLKYTFAQSQPDDLDWYPSLEEFGNMLNSLYKSEEIKKEVVYHGKAEGGEFPLKYLIRRMRGEEHEDIKDEFKFKK